MTRRAKVDPDVVTHDSCACGCGCQPDGDWHWSQQPWCRCVANACDCVTDVSLGIEPTALYSVRRDREGDLWMRGRKWWYCQSVRGKLRWSHLVDQYGPMQEDAETERLQALGREGGRARD